MSARAIISPPTRSSGTARPGEVRAKGNVVVLTPQGDKLIGDNVAADRHAARRDDRQSAGRARKRRRGSPPGAGRARGDVTTLENAIYSPCPVTTATGCPKRPSWAITAARVIDDPGAAARPLRGRPAAAVRGQPAAAAGLQHRTRQRTGRRGWLVPDISYLDPQGLRDRGALSLADRAQPRPDAHAARLHRRAAGDRSQVSRAQQPRRVPARRLPDLRHDRQASTRRPPSDEPQAFRGYFEGNGRFQLDPLWSITGSLRAATDKTVTRRYDITRDDRLRNFVNAERISPNSATSRSPAGPSRACASTIVQKQIPIALPAIDARFRLDDVAGGKVELAGQQPVDHPHRRPGHAARLRQRAVGPAAADAVGPGVDADRLRPRRRLSYRRCGRAPPSPIYRGTDGWHARAHRRARRRHEMAVRRPLPSAASSGSSRASSSC